MIFLICIEHILLFLSLLLSPFFRFETHVFTGWIIMKETKVQIEDQTCPPHHAMCLLVLSVAIILEEDLTIRLVPQTFLDNDAPPPTAECLGANATSKTMWLQLTLYQAADLYLALYPAAWEEKNSLIHCLCMHWHSLKNQGIHKLLLDTLTVEDHLVQV